MSTINKGLVMTKGSEYLPDLPEEIMIEILQRLPVDSILAAKCLSKQWDSLVGDPKFYNLYRTTSMVLFVFEDSLYCVLFKHHNNCTQNISKGVLPPYSLHSLPIRIGEVGFCHELLPGCFNGLSCVLTHGIGHFVVYNLLAGTSFVVSDCPQQPWFYYGFGYDRRADDYKILVVPCYKDDASRWVGYNPVDDENEDTCQFWVYSFKNRCWKSFSGFPYAAYTFEEAACFYDGAYPFNGVLHSVAIRAGESPKEKKRAMEKGKPRPVAILTFDLHTCRFGQIAVPCGRRLAPFVCTVMELDGRLCFMAKESKTLEVWVMKESWTKLFCCPLSTRFPVYELAYAALYDCGDGNKKALFAFHGDLQLFWYDFNNNKIEETAWCDFPAIRTL